MTKKEILRKALKIIQRRIIDFHMVTTEFIELTQLINKALADTEDTDEKCPECGKEGNVENGRCLRCGVPIEYQPPKEPEEKGCICQECGKKYKVDFLVPNEIWSQIGPKGTSAGLLCGQCICRKIEALGEFNSFHLFQPKEQDDEAIAEVWSAFKERHKGITAWPYLCFEGGYDVACGRDGQ